MTDKCGPTVLVGATRGHWNRTRRASGDTTTSCDEIAPSNNVLTWVTNSRPERLPRLAEQGRLDSGLIPVSLADFVLSTICGSEPGAEITNAMAYGLLNLKSLDWHEEVISGLGLDQ